MNILYTLERGVVNHKMEGNMNESMRLKRILSDRIAKEDEVLRRTTEWVEIAPFIQMQKEQDETSLAILNSVPEEIAEEIAPKLLQIEEENNKIIVANLPDIPSPRVMAIKELSTTGSGTVTPYVSAITNIMIPYNPVAEKQPEWVKESIVIIGNHTHRVAQREYIPQRLDKLNPNLGKMCREAFYSFNRCQNGIIGVDVSANHFRDILQQIWGGLVSMTDVTNKNSNRNTKNLQLRKEGDRNLVADILATDIFPKRKLLALLSDMYDLYYNLSDTKFGKNILNRDFPRLKTYYTQWLTILDGISGLLI